MKINQNQSHNDIKETVVHVEITFKLIEVFNSLLEILIRLHFIITATLERITTIIPPIGILFMGLGHLAALFNTQKQSKKSRISIGIKLFIGISLIAVAALGIAFPPAGMAMVATGFGLTIGLTLYKMCRTSYKLSQAKEVAKKAREQNDTEKLHQHQLDIDKHNHKMVSRKINTSVAILSCALIVITAAFPPAGIVCFGILIGVNTSYSLYRMRKPIKQFLHKLGTTLSSALGFKPRLAVKPLSTTQIQPKPPTLSQLKKQTSEQNKKEDDSDSGTTHIMHSSEQDTAATTKIQTENETSHPEEDDDDRDGGTSHVMNSHQQDPATAQTQTVNSPKKEISHLEEDDDDRDGGASHVMNSHQQDPATAQTQADNSPQKETSHPEEDDDDRDGGTSHVMNSQQQDLATAQTPADNSSQKEISHSEEDNDDRDGGASHVMALTANNKLKDNTHNNALDSSEPTGSHNNPLSNKIDSQKPLKPLANKNHKPMIF